MERPERFNGNMGPDPGVPVVPQLPERLWFGGSDEYLAVLSVQNTILHRMEALLKLQQSTKGVVDELHRTAMGKATVHVTNSDDFAEFRRAVGDDGCSMNPLEGRMTLLPSIASRTVPKREFPNEPYEANGGVSVEMYSNLVSQLHWNSSDVNSESDSDSSFGVTAYVFLQKLMMAPTSKRLICIDILSACALLIDMWAIPYVLAWDYPPYGILSSCLIATAVWWTLTIGFAFLTGLHHMGEVELRPEVIAKKYLRGAFPREAVICLCDWFGLAATMVLQNDQAFMTVGKIPRTLRLLRLLRFSTVLRVDMCVQRVKEHIESVSYRVGVIHFESLSFFVRTATLFMSILWANHLLGCAWFALGTSAWTDTGLRWPDTLIVGDSWGGVSLKLVSPTSRKCSSCMVRRAVRVTSVVPVTLRNLFHIWRCGLVADGCLLLCVLAPQC